jgi:hypothetical protein
MLERIVRSETEELRRAAELAKGKLLRVAAAEEKLRRAKEELLAGNTEYGEDLLDEVMEILKD